MPGATGRHYRRRVRVLVALGGNAMTGPDGSAEPAAQIEAVTRAAGDIARLVVAGHRVLVTHGNGPQVGNLLVKNELAAAVVPPVPLDWCGAQTQGTIGFILLDALADALAEQGSDARPAVVVSRTLVAAEDPGFASPSKPIGRYLPRDEAAVLIEHGQTWQDRGSKGWRRVVASPEPVEALDAPAVRTLLEAGFLVVAGGGGGIPVVREADGTLRGVEAVVDKDLAAVVLARAVGIDVLVVATDVEHAVLGWGTDDERPVGRTTPAELRALAGQGHFASGSMGPKVDAVARFVGAGGTLAVITTLEKIDDALAGDVGTAVHPD